MTNQNEQNDVLRDCKERLEKLGIAYMLTGSMALVYYAMPRTTVDIDVVLSLSIDDADRFIKEFEPDYYVPHGRVREAIYRRKMFNILHQETIIKIDCIIRINNEFQQEAFSRRERVNYAGFDVWIISREDLILSKLNWAKNTHSEIQLRDVANILRNGYDENYVESWTKKLNLKNLLEEAKKKLEENAE